jgi:hypothetical protein
VPVFADSKHLAKAHSQADCEHHFDEGDRGQNADKLVCGHPHFPEAPSVLLGRVLLLANHYTQSADEATNRYWQTI